MNLKSTLYTLSILLIAACFLIKSADQFNQTHDDSTTKIAALNSNTADSPKMTLWRVDSAHLNNSLQGTAYLWPCGDEYYFNYQANTNEDIIIEIKNDGAANLTLELPLKLADDSYGSISIIEQPSISELAPGEETHFIVRSTGGASYIHSEATVVINSNSIIQSSCSLLFEVGTGCTFSSAFGSATINTSGTQVTDRKSVV